MRIIFEMLFNCSAFIFFLLTFPQTLWSFSPASWKRHISSRSTPLNPLFRQVLSRTVICSVGDNIEDDGDHIRSMPIAPAQVKSVCGELITQCAICINDSKKKFSSGNEYYSNPKPQMGTWVDQELLNRLVDCIDDVTFNASASFNSLLGIQTVTGSDTGVSLVPSTPIAASISRGEEFDVNLLVLPAGQTINTRVHASGTVLLYKVIAGEGWVQTRIDGRLIQNDLLGLTNSSTARTLRRIGGPVRSISASNNSDITNGETQQGFAVLEVALHPPAASAPHFDGGLGVQLDTDSSLEEEVLRLQVPPPQLDTLFASRTEMLRLDELSARSAAVDSDRAPHGKRNQGEKQRLTGDMYRVQTALNMNIGGLGEELNSLVRRILYTRNLPASVLSALGVSHVRGILLHGPPGTGKTLIARELARALNARPPKIVNGPEIIDKFVGEAERNIRALFVDAEEEWARLGPRSPLHVIVFDELDSIAKRRGSLSGDGSGVRDSCVNQLLSKIDGVQQMNNVLVVGMTNRMDLLDPALLRAGRLEVQIKIDAPDEAGRQEILAILLRSMVQSGAVDIEDALHWCEQYAARCRTDGWTGADLAGLIRSAVSFALERFFEELLQDDNNGGVTTSPVELEYNEIIKRCRITEVELDMALIEMEPLASPARESTFEETREEKVTPLEPVTTKRKRLRDFFQRFLPKRLLRPFFGRKGDEDVEEELNDERVDPFDEQLLRHAQLKDILLATDIEDYSSPSDAGKPSAAASLEIGDSHHNADQASTDFDGSNARYYNIVEDAWEMASNV